MRYHPHHPKSCIPAVVYCHVVKSCIVFGSAGGGGRGQVIISEYVKSLRNQTKNFEVLQYF